MRYKIKRIKSEHQKWERIALITVLMIYFLCFAISRYYCDASFPVWMFETYKRI